MEMALSKTFTLSQKVFVEEIAAGADKNAAALKAGYSDARPDSEAWRLLQQPAILAAIQMAVSRRLAAGAGAAVRVLQDFLVDETLDKRLRVVCAKTLLDRAGHIAPKAAAAASGSSVPLNEMSMTDLRALADKLEGEIAGRAKDVSGASVAPKKAQTLEDIM